MTDRATQRTPNGPSAGPDADRPPQDPAGGPEKPADDAAGTPSGPPSGTPSATPEGPPPGTSPATPDGTEGARAGRPHRHNTQLATLIAEAGFSHAGLARRVDRLGQEHGLDLRYDKTSVTRWLRGQQPRGTSPALIAEVFTQRLGRRLSAQDLGLDACAPVYAGLEYAASAAEAVDIVSGLWRKDTGNQAELRKIAFSPAGLVVPSRDWLIGAADDTLARRGAGLVPAQTRGGPRAAQDLRTAPQAAPAGRVGAGDIAALGAVADLFRTLDHAYGGGHARQALVRYLEHEAEPMLRGSYTEAQGRRLFASVADLTRLAGWTSYDIGAHGLAQRYFVQALRLTQAAGDRVHGGYVLVTMSRQAVHLGHGREAVQLARVAQQGIGTTAPAAVQALMHAAEARGHGVLGDTRACTAALARAERAFAAARSGDELPPWARFFDEAQLADEFAHCHRDLQQHRAAVQHAERSLQLRAAGYARSRLFCRTVLATSRLALGEVDAACALGAEVVRQAADMRSTRAAEYARDFARRLDPYRDTAPGRQFFALAASTGLLA
ncbi:regulator [Streptomyces cocklensis]|uniref:55.5 kDa and 49.5 kDa sporulation proteins n=1 Tax=Actinacidiphila cocklensis TaxID=887465 RepID=A0A9W4GW35_9ACTN|nr:proline-rich domain-containing protein [Actinacidiphila cocklensis]MDD1062248.1 regulator [Actinacidiphila cocklensis]CAG6399222.1 putative 55.5 kDa and 49.5 kDa sporulation proteins [Actinacidiphila cocklensis]